MSIHNSKKAGEKAGKDKIRKEIYLLAGLIPGLNARQEKAGERRKNRAERETNKQKKEKKNSSNILKMFAIKKDHFDYSSLTEAD